MMDDAKSRLGRRTKLVAFVLALTVVVSIPLAVAAYSDEYFAVAHAGAVGNVTVLWGNPFETTTVSYGTGWERVAIRGWAYPLSNIEGYYVFEEMRLTGSVHAQWTNASNSYTLDASIFLRTQDTAYMPTYIVPGLDAFAALGTDFTPDSTVTLTANGNPTQFKSIAAVIAAVPGQFDFKGQYRATTIIFYISTYFQIVISWSEHAQTVHGIYEPACTRLVQSVRILW